jgi:hypothetical protein
MGLGGILQELKTEGVLALYHDYRSGRLVDYSGNGRDGVGTGVSFTKDGVRFTPVAANITVPYGAWMNVNDLTLIIYVNFSNTPGQDRLVARRDGGGTSFDWRREPINLSVFNGTADVSLATSSIKSVLGFSWTSGGTPNGYINGTFAGAYTSAVARPSTTTNLVIGNLLGGSATTNKIFYYFLYITRILTATEHARIYSQLENMTWNTKGLTPGPMMP